MQAESPAHSWALRARTERIALAALIAGAMGIGFSPIFVRLSELGPSATAFHRVALAAPVLALWLAADARRGGPSARQPRALRHWLLLGLAGVFFAADLAFYHWSITITTVTNATLLSNCVPFFVTFAAWALFGERFGGAFLAGTALAIAGAALLVGDSLSLSAGRALGDASGVAASLFYSGYILVVARLRATFSTATIMTWSAAASALCLLPLAWVAGESVIAETARGWLVLVGLALVSQTASQSLITHALAHLPAAFSSVSLLLQPVTATALGWAILGEKLGALQATGVAIVLAGIVIARRASRSP
jgi:drug/metabolite transporter (DMT)-like permease